MCSTRWRSRIANWLPGLQFADFFFCQSAATLGGILSVKEDLKAKKVN